MAKLITVYWRDIPAQVIVKQGRKSKKAVLTPRFAEAIDRAAMRAKKTDSDAYLEDWRRVSENCGDDLEQVAADAIARLEAEYDDARVDRIMRAHGRDLEQADASE